ncbi:MAG: sporulation protein YabP [Oscillospiraceae bacterium]
MTHFNEKENLQEKNIKLPHNIIVEDRKKIVVSGVSDIDNFDEETIVLFTSMGLLTIKGINLHINKLNVETGELFAQGEVNSFFYSEATKKQTGLFSKIFK